MTDPPFEIGDTVRLKGGNSPIRVISVDFFSDGKQIPCYAKRKWVRKRIPKEGWYIEFQYLSSFHYLENRGWREAYDFVLYDQQLEKETIPMDVLYQTKEEKPRFGIHRGVNGAGQLILEMKGPDANYEAFDSKDIEEVLPYTVNLEPLLKGDSGSKHVVCTEGQVALQDVILELHTGRFFRVTALNTKCRAPVSNKSKWMKVPLVPLVFGTDEDA